MVQFYFITQSQYNSAAKNAEALYFTTDTLRIYKGEFLYADAKDQLDLIEALEQAIGQIPNVDVTKFALRSDTEGCVDLLYNSTVVSNNIKINGWDAFKEAFDGHTTAIASSSALGHIKTGYTTSGKNYAVQVDEDGDAYVNVPWSDNNITYSIKTSSSTTQGTITLDANSGTDTSVNLKGAGTVSVKSDASGNITITGSNSATNAEHAETADYAEEAGHAETADTATNANHATSADSALEADKLTTNAGSTTKPVYFANGIPVEIGYTIAKSVPSDAKFTDTTYDVVTTDEGDTGLMSAEMLTKLNDAYSDINAFLANADLTTDAIDTLAEIQAQLDAGDDSAASLLAEINKIKSGDTVVKKAESATSATNAGHAETADEATHAVDADTADVATKLGTETVGSTTQPIYLNAGVPTEIGYTIAKSVPSDAKFTDTNNKTTQSAPISTAGEYSLLHAYNTTTSAVTNATYKASGLTYNPSTKVLTTPNLKADKINGVVPVLTDTTYTFTGTNGITASGTTDITIDGSQIQEAIENLAVTASPAAANDATVLGGLSASGMGITSATKTITGGTAMSVSGTTSKITINHADVPSAEGNAGPTAGATLAHGDSFTVPYVSYNKQGHVTGHSNRTFTLPELPVDKDENVKKAAITTGTFNVALASNSTVADSIKYDANLTYNAATNVLEASNFSSTNGDLESVIAALTWKTSV